MIPLMKGTTTISSSVNLPPLMQMIPLMKGTTTTRYGECFSFLDANDPINEGNYNR